MKRREHPVSNHQILAEASEWFAAFRFDDVDATARKRFSEWLRSSPVHIHAYLELAQLWAEMPGGEARGQVGIEAFLEAPKTADAEIIPLDTSSPAPARIPTRTPRRILKVAFAAVASLLIAFVGWWSLGGYTEYRTDKGEQRSITLADGSFLDLNSESAVRVHFTRQVREVNLLAGQALFRVAKDKQRPFVVVAGTREVIAVGTQFDVQRHDGSTIVTVIEGRVAVTSPGSDFSRVLWPNSSVDPSVLAGGMPADLLLIGAGEQAIVTPQSAVKPKHADIVTATAWVQQKLVFEATPLSEVVDQFNRYSARHLVVDDPRLATLGISGVYSSTDPGSLLLFLRSQPGIRIVESEQTVRITSATP
ncbi:MAG: FecR domain-containing protein [Rudaea sp.]|uniref:FecR family protein n=1 Tax=Rudaea sp. TaxID=2136325 RepID=UPI0039E2C3D6